jgi:Arc/MetJ family transcription regulator
MIHMRTTLDLPDGLVDEARTVAGFKSKTDTVVYALKEVVRRKRKDDLMALLRRIDFGDTPAKMRRKDRARAGM